MWNGPCIETYDKYQGINEMIPYAKAMSAKSYAFDSLGEETTIEYRKMIEIVKKHNYQGFIGVEFEGNDLDEVEGILKTKVLLEKYL